MNVHTFWPGAPSLEQNRNNVETEQRFVLKAEDFPPIHTVIGSKKSGGSPQERRLGLKITRIRSPLAQQRFPAPQGAPQSDGLDQRVVKAASGTLPAFLEPKPLPRAVLDPPAQNPAEGTFYESDLQKAENPLPASGPLKPCGHGTVDMEALAAILNSNIREHGAFSPQHNALLKDLEDMARSRYLERRGELPSGFNEKANVFSSFLLSRFVGQETALSAEELRRIMDDFVDVNPLLDECLGISEPAPTPAKPRNGIMRRMWKAVFG